MKIIQIEESKKTELAEGIEEMLRIGGKLMSCVEELGEEEGQIGMRGGGNMGYRSGGGMGYREGGGSGSSMGYRGRGGYRMGEMRPMGRGGYMQYEDPYYM